MCGILGIYVASGLQHPVARWQQLISRLLILSESRGKEAAGLAVGTDEGIYIYKKALSASKMLKEESCIRFLAQSLSAAKAGGPLAIIGHARLATNGIQDKASNNQPIARNGVIMVHNGIAVNDKQLWQALPNFSPETEVDTEVLAATLGYLCKENGDMPSALEILYQRLEGDASIAFMHNCYKDIYLATNTGSLYYTLQNGMLIFASERLILQRLLDDKNSSYFNFSNQIDQIKAGYALHCTPDADDLSISHFSISEKAVALPPVKTHYRKLEDQSQCFESARKSIRRCTRCILPETMPFIRFDENGICNYCHAYTLMPVQGLDAAKVELKQQGIHAGATDNNRNNALLMLSGGRDSCYGMHLAVKEFGLKPIAYTYDWGLVTDIARRNTSRMCSKLGVEHIVVSADIPWKRRNVRKNILAWLQKPSLGMVPLFMAGDKQYFHYANQVCKANNLGLILVSENPLELTKFKSGFCGVDESNNRIYDIPALSKIKLLGYYAKEFLANPRYINSTFLDTMFAFFSFYLEKHDFMHLYQYERWDEEKINSTLIDGYDWETDKNAHSTWRIGDGTAAFYNYIYYEMAGFTENDTLRSNQIREGMMSREEALRRVELENQPRWDSLIWYASVVGFNLSEALNRINLAPKRYCQA